MDAALHSKYVLKITSNLQVNIDRTTCQEVAKLIAEGKADDTSLDSVFTVVKINLSDTFSRFKTSQSYTTYLKGTEAKKKIIKRSGIW